jgi:hypothetical protein
MKVRLAGHVERMGEKRNAYRLLVGKPEGKRLGGKPREIGRGCTQWIGVAQDRDKWRALVNAP